MPAPLGPVTRPGRQGQPSGLWTAYFAPIVAARG